MNAVRTLALTLIVLVGVYLLAWIGWYMSMMGTNFEYVLPYFRYGWKGGGERPTFIQFFAIATTVLAAFPVWLLVRRRHKRKSLNGVVYGSAAIGLGVICVGAAWQYSDAVSSKVEWSILQKAMRQERPSTLVGSAVVVEADGHHVLRVDAENGRDHVWIMLDAKHEPFVKRLPDLPYRMDIMDIAKIFSSGVASQAVRLELTMHARR